MLGGTTMKKFLYLLPIIFLSIIPISPPLNNTSYNDKASIMTTSLSDSSIKFMSKEIQSKDSFLELNLKYPVLSGLENKTKQDQINAVFKNYIDKISNEMKKCSLKNSKNNTENQTPLTPYTATTDFEVKHIGKSIISLYINYYQYTGGAHGMHGKKPFNFDLTSGRQLELKDIFKIGTDYKKLLSVEIEKQMKQKQVHYFDDAAYTIKSLPNTQPFYFTNTGIVIYYGLYEITPYADGPQEFTIPYDYVKDYLIVSP